MPNKISAERLDEIRTQIISVHYCKNNEEANCRADLQGVMAAKDLLAEVERLKQREKEALDMIVSYRGIDGDHHKLWVLDQIVQILADSYEDFIRPYGADWDKGIAP